MSLKSLFSRAGASQQGASWSEAWDPAAQRPEHVYRPQQGGLVTTAGQAPPPKRHFCHKQAAKFRFLKNNIRMLCPAQIDKTSSRWKDLEQSYSSELSRVRKTRPARSFERSKARFPAKLQDFFAESTVSLLTEDRTVQRTPRPCGKSSARGRTRTRPPHSNKILVLRHFS